MTGRENSEIYLKLIGADGLVSPSGDCGCGLDDLAPCCEAMDRCRPARWRLCDDCQDRESCDIVEARHVSNGCFCEIREEGET